MTKQERRRRELIEFEKIVRMVRKGKLTNEKLCAFATRHNPLGLTASQENNLDDSLFLLQIILDKIEAGKLTLKHLEDFVDGYNPFGKKDGRPSRKALLALYTLHGSGFGCH